MEVNCNGDNWSLGWTDDPRTTNFCNHLWALRIVGIFKEGVKKLTLFIFCYLIYGCSSSSPSESDSIQETLTLNTPIFKPNPIILEDSVSYYSSACNNPSFQFLIPTDINNDRYVDFIAHFWCDSETPAEISFNDVPDILVAYVSDDYGIYNVDNVDVFGELYPKLGGSSRKYARGDINQDGKDDFAFAMNSEDGRAAYDFDSWQTNYALPAVLLSTNSGYEIVNIGKKDWGHSVQIHNNKVLFGGHSSQAFKYMNSSWHDISHEYIELSFASFLVFDDYILNSVRRGSSQGLELIKNNQIVSSVMKNEKFKVYFEGWNNDGTGNYQEMGVYEIGNNLYFNGMATEMCRKDNLIVATVNASKPFNRDIIENEYYSETETTPVVLLSFYEIIDNQIIEKDIKVINEEINHNYNFFDCVDVNQDQKKDIIAQVFSQAWNDQSPNNKGVPEIYINSGGGEYFNLDTLNWPEYSINDDSQGYLYDVNKDGNQDLVMFPLKANFTANVEIYLSNKNILQ